MPLWLRRKQGVSSEEPRLGKSSLAVCTATMAALVLHGFPYGFAAQRLQFLYLHLSSPQPPHHSKAGEADLSPKITKNKLWTLIEIWDSHHPREGWSLSLPGKPARGYLHSGSQIQGRRNTQKKMIMGVLKTCPFLPNPGQYLQRGHINKQTFFSVKKSPTKAGSSRAQPCPAPVKGLESEFTSQLLPLPWWLSCGQSGQDQCCSYPYSIQPLYTGKHSERCLVLTQATFIIILFKCV